MTSQNISRRDLLREAVGYYPNFDVFPELMSLIFIITVGRENVVEVLQKL